MARAFLGLGSNLDPERHLLAALHLLRRRVRVVAVSTVYRTPALGRPEQPDFYNAVAEIATELPPRVLKFGVLRPIEAELGRRREEDRYAPRPIDLDLLAYDEVSLAEEGLVLPDPELWSRPFLAHPLHELAPDLVLPGGESIADVAARLPREEMHPLPEYTERVREALHHEP